MTPTEIYSTTRSFAALAMFEEANRMAAVLQKVHRRKQHYGSLVRYEADEKPAKVVKPPRLGHKFLGVVCEWQTRKPRREEREDAALYQARVDVAEVVAPAEFDEVNRERFYREQANRSQSRNITRIMAEVRRVQKRAKDFDLPMSDDDFAYYGGSDDE